MRPTCVRLWNRATGCHIALMARERMAGCQRAMKPAHGSHIRPFGQSKCIVDIDAETANRTRDLGGAEQKPDRPQILRRLVDDRGRRTPQRMRAIIVSP